MEENNQPKENWENIGKDDKKQDLENSEERPKEPLDEKSQVFRPEMLETNSSSKEKINTTYILLAVFIVLLGVSYIIRNKPFDKNELGQANKIISSVEASEIKKCEITRNKKTYTLENQENSWKVMENNNTYPADQEAIKSVVDESLKLNRYILASDNKEKQKEFEVDEDKGINVKLYTQDKEVSNFFIGKAGPDFDSTYLRLANEDKVYLSKGYVRFYFDKEDWKDLKIYEFEQAHVKKIALKYRNVKDNALLEKEEDKWKIASPKNKVVEQAKIDPLLSTISHLEATDIELKKNAKECGFGAAALVIRLELDDNTKKNLIIGGKLEKEDKYYVKREEDSNIYIVNKTSVDNLIKKTGDF